MNKENLEEHSWYRALKVLYLLLYIPLPFLIGIFILDVGRDWVCLDAGRLTQCSYVWDHIDEAMLASVAIALSYVLILEILRRVTLYIVVGKKKQPPVPPIQE